MGRHGKGSEAVGKYYLQRDCKDQFQTGWISVCECCAASFEKYDIESKLNEVLK